MMKPFYLTHCPPRAPTFYRLLRVSLLVLSAVACNAPALAQTVNPTPDTRLTHSPDSAQQRLALMGIDVTAERLVQYAAQGDSNVLALLLQAGLDVNAVDAKRRVSALHNAAAQGHVRIIKTLLERGAKIDALDWYGNTPLINAAWYGQPEAVKLLLASGAQVNSVSNQGQSALTAAIYSGKVELVRSLLAQGADPTLPASLNALRVAELAGRTNMVQAIQQRMEQK